MRDSNDPVVEPSESATDEPGAAAQPDAAEPGRMPALYLGHGAPTMLDDETWPVELAAWASFASSISAPPS